MIPFPKFDLNLYEAPITTFGFLKEQNIHGFLLNLMIYCFPLPRVTTPPDVPRNELHWKTFLAVEKAAWIVGYCLDSIRRTPTAAIHCLLVFLP